MSFDTRAWQVSERRIGMDHFLNTSSMFSLNEFCSSLKAGHKNRCSIVSAEFPWQRLQMVVAMFVDGVI